MAGPAVGLASGAAGDVSALSGMAMQAKQKLAEANAILIAMQEEKGGSARSKLEGAAQVVAGGRGKGNVLSVQVGGIQQKIEKMRALLATVAAECDQVATQSKGIENEIRSWIAVISR